MRGYDDPEAETGLGEVITVMHRVSGQRMSNIPEGLLLASSSIYNLVQHTFFLSSFPSWSLPSKILLVNMPVLHSLGENGLIANLSLPLLVAISLPVLFLSYVVYQRSFHPLANVPGPYWASITRLWMVKHSIDGDMHRTMIALHEKHGSLVRTGPNEVSVADPNTIKQIYGAGTKFEKSDWYSVWQGHRTFDLFAERSERIHGQQRKLVSRPYAMESLKDLEPYVDETTQLFLRKMDERLGQVVDMGNWFQLFAFGTSHNNENVLTSVADETQILLAR